MLALEIHGLSLVEMHAGHRPVVHQLHFIYSMSEIYPIKRNDNFLTVLKQKICQIFSIECKKYVRVKYKFLKSLA